MANENAIPLEIIQLGLESTAGTLVPATYKWSGKGSVKFLTEVVLPDYTLGTGGGSNVEDAYVAGDGTELTLADTDLTAEGLVWLLNMGVKQVLGPATTFTFDFPVSTPNTLSTFTFEYATGVQEYEFGYGFAKKIGISASAVDNNGIARMNATIVGRKSTPATLTATLSQLGNRQPLSLRGGTLKLDALGTAYGTAEATANTLRAFSLDIDQAWTEEYYADGRADKDFSVAQGGAVNYKLTGECLFAFNSACVTEIANARAATGRILEVALAGTSSRAVKFQLPIVWKPNEITIGDQDSNGLRLVRIPYEARYSRTTTAQSPQIVCTLSTLTTVT